MRADFYSETFNVVMLTFAACASIGYAMCAIVSSILDSIVATVFVCFAEVRESDACIFFALKSGMRRIAIVWLAVD